MKTIMLEEDMFQAAINDGINVYVREVLGKNGFLSDEYDQAASVKIDREKYAVVQKVAARWIADTDS